MTNAICADSVVGLTLPERAPAYAGSSSGGSALARRAAFQPITERGFKLRVTGVRRDSEPKWRSAVEEGVGLLLDLPPGWDSYGAPTISHNAIAAAVAAIFAVSSSETVPPIIVPTSAGGCQLEWHSDVVDIEIEFAPTAESSVFMRERTSGRCWEGSLETNVEYIREFLEPLRVSI
jgi:hypothetical protein